MTRLFLIFFTLLISINLYAISDSVLLKRANANLYSKNKSDVFRSYNDFKSLYLRAVMNENQSLKIKALKGIVNSGNKLHIDVSVYQKELRKIPKTKYNKPTPKPNKKSKKLKKVKLKSVNKLKSLYWKGDRLYLVFDKKLKNSAVNYFKLYDAKTNTYKYVFDIHAKITKSKHISKRGIESIKIAQYTPYLVRVVFKNKSVLKVRFKLSKNKLIINVKPLKKSSYKATKKVTKPTYKPFKPNKIIVIDAGHGGKDPGAIGYRRYREKVIVLDIAKFLRNELKRRGYKVYMTRSSDKFIKLSNRTKYANRKKADLFISIHANAARSKKAYGIETYFLSPTRSSRAKKVAAMENKTSMEDMNYYGKMSFLTTLNHHLMIQANKLAIDIQRNVLANLRKKYKNVKDGGVREGPFWVLVGAQMPSVLIEVGFVTNPKEAKRLVNINYQKRFAKGIADGIDSYFIKN